MANLGICKRCDKIYRFYRGRLSDAGQRLLSASAWCDLHGGVPASVEWDSNVPEDCPYSMEHLMTKDTMDDLAEEARDARESLRRANEA